MSILSQIGLQRMFGNAGDKTEATGRHFEDISQMKLFTSLNPSLQDHRNSLKYSVFIFYQDV